MIESILKELSEIVNSTEDDKKVMDEIVRLTTTLLQVGNCSLLLIDNETDEMHIHAAYGLSPEIVSNFHARIGEGISGWVAKTGKPLLIENIETHPLFHRKNRAHYSTKSLLSAPLIHEKRTIGVLNVNNRNDGGAFTKADEETLCTLAKFVVVALEKSWEREKQMARNKTDSAK
jgi:signal transduction protein with GAF and PtsI domain